MERRSSCEGGLFTLNPVKTFLLAAISPVAALAQTTAPGPYDWRDWGPWHMWGGWGFGWIFPMFFMVLLLALCVLFVGRMLWGHGHSRGEHTCAALQILSERFAKGEISKEEFEEKRAILARHP